MLRIRNLWNTKILNKNIFQNDIKEAEHLCETL
jgi:hypothetical protein